MPGSTAHQALKANNASEWFSVYRVLGGQWWEGAAGSARLSPHVVARLCDFHLPD